MTTEDLLAILTERGFSLHIWEDDTPAISGPVDMATPALMRVLALHRDKLLQHIRAAEKVEVRPFDAPGCGGELAGASTATAAGRGG
jgi:hypothetical protein